MIVRGKPQNWREAVTHLSRSDDMSEIELLCSRIPEIISTQAIAQVEFEIDAIEAGGAGDSWGLTGAAIMQKGAARGELGDALFRVRTRDLLPLGPDGIDQMAQRHPELFGRRCDILRAAVAATPLASPAALAAD